jgi:hypothetical protein
VLPGNASLLLDGNSQGTSPYSSAMPVSSSTVLNSEIARFLVALETFLIKVGELVFLLV